MSDRGDISNDTNLRKSEVCVFWFRRDLRLDDNRALRNALRSGLPVLPLFIFDTEILSRLHSRRDARVEFIQRALVGLQRELRAIDADLLVEHGSPIAVFEKLLERFSVSKVFTNRDYEPYAISRDQKVSKLLESRDVDFLTFKDQVIFEGGEIQKAAGGPYTVFTPYARKWQETLGPQGYAPESCRDEWSGFYNWRGKDVLSLEDLGFAPSGIDFPEAKLSGAMLRSYASQRNTPAEPGTSRLGVHLRFGTLSVREAVRVARAESQDWLRELIWREFFMQILWHFPHVAEGPFRPEYSRIPWRENEEDFQAWREGRTGVPIVDAGMRELNATGFMHNRVRMIAASFLVKHLLIDWRRGEEYFAEKLLDFELASNNGNWQWIAGSGCDAAPYFRVFNPEIQTKKFDPDLRYVRRWVPEVGTEKYPEPIVDHVLARTRALRAYGVGLGKKAPEPDKTRMKALSPSTDVASKSRRAARRKRPTSSL